MNDNQIHGRRPAKPSPFHWLNEMHFRRSDLPHFGAELRLERGRLLACHRDPDGRELGWEAVHRAADGSLRYFYPKGQHKGLFRAPLPTPTTLVLTAGVLQAIAYAGLHKPDAETAVAAGGGWWSGLQLQAIASLQRRGLLHVTLAYPTTDAGIHMAEMATNHLAVLPVTVMRHAPEGRSWLEDLAAARSAPAQEAAA